MEVTTTLLWQRGFALRLHRTPTGTTITVRDSEGQRQEPAETWAEQTLEVDKLRSAGWRVIVTLTHTANSTEQDSLDEAFNHAWETSWTRRLADLDDTGDTVELVLLENFEATTALMPWGAKLRTRIATLAHLADDTRHRMLVIAPTPLASWLTCYYGLPGTPVPSHLPADPADTELTLRTAYLLWSKDPGSALSKLAEALSAARDVCG